MIMKDFVSPNERMKLIDFVDHVCAGCGQTAEEIAVEQNLNDKDFEDYSCKTNWGHWYCHKDCYKDCF